jgi:hypothetical protein
MLGTVALCTAGSYNVLPGRYVLDVSNEVESIFQFNTGSLTLDSVAPAATMGSRSQVHMESKAA